MSTLTLYNHYKNWAKSENMSFENDQENTTKSTKFSKQK